MPTSKLTIGVLLLFAAPSVAHAKGPDERAPE
jgi:hypothetical protein